MRVIVEGEEKGKRKRYTYYLFDRYNHETKTSSMARTTGYTATAAANLVLNGQYKKKGIISPERGRDGAPSVSYYRTLKTERLTTRLRKKVYS